MTDTQLASKLADGLIAQLVDLWHTNPRGPLTFESLDAHTQSRVRVYADLIKSDLAPAFECLSEDAAVEAYFEDRQLHAPDAYETIDAVWQAD